MIIDLFSGEVYKPNREFKGKSLLSLVGDYTVIDLETTGYEPTFDDIIEIGAIKYRNDVEIDRFHSFVKSDRPLDPFIVEHTGICDDMLKGAPGIAEILPSFLKFVGDDVIVAHNANFDINFIYDNAFFVLKNNFTNNFVDTLRLAKWCNLPVENKRLTTLAAFFAIPQDVAHRSIADCETTAALYYKLKQYINDNNISLRPKGFDGRVAKIVADNGVEIDPDNLFYNQVVVFTGALDSMQRADAAKIVANLGGILGDNVTKKTNYLVLGSFAYHSTVKDGKSTKQKKAESLILSGQDLHIISESVFLSMIDDK